MESGTAPAAAQRFAVDRMLGRHARWLRILGHDVSYGPRLGGRALLAHARREGRMVLTRDTRLCAAATGPHLVLVSDDFRAQLREVAAAVPLGPARRFARCLECNCPLEDVTRAAAEHRVPPFVWSTQDRFLRCPDCDRFYWPATHRMNMLHELAALGLTSGATDERC